MSIAAVVLTHNPIKHERFSLLASTIESLREADRLYVVDNGSTDGTAAALEQIPHLGTLTNHSGLTTSGHGNMLAGRVGAGTDADIVVLSDDDMEWKPGWADTLERWWKNAPDGLWLTGCHLEPEFPWNKIQMDVTYGGIRGLQRASTGAASWSFRRADWTGRFAPIIQALPTATQGHWDVPFCAGIREAMGKIAQLDIAEHAGHGKSTWGNRTVDLYGWDVEPVRARL